MLHGRVLRLIAQFADECLVEPSRENRENESVPGRYMYMMVMAARNERRNEDDGGSV